MMDNRRRGPRGDLSADVLLAAAERVLDGGDLSALSLRAVAREADVTPTAVYTYFSDMADLRHRLGDRLLGRLDLDLLTAPAPALGLRQFLRHVFSVFAAAPGQVHILASQRILGPGALALNEALLSFFIDRVGQSPRTAAAATELVTEWMHGALLLSTSNHPLPAGISFSGYPRTALMLTGAERDGGNSAAPADSPGGWMGDDTALDLLVRAVTLPPS